MGGVTSDRLVFASPTMSDSPRITRRSLFRGVGSVTVVAGCATPPKPTPTPAPDLAAATPPIDGVALGPGPAPLRFTLNGAVQTVEVAPSTTLLDSRARFLRPRPDVDVGGQQPTPRRRSVSPLARGLLGVVP